MIPKRPPILSSHRPVPGKPTVPLDAEQQQGKPKGKKPRNGSRKKPEPK